MCKIMTVIGIENGKEDKLKKFVEAATPYLTASDSDGFGYVAVNEQGMFGERWLDVDKAWELRQAKTLFEAQIEEEMNGSVFFAESYNRFGDVVENLKGVTSICLHARMSTNSISMQNTHPFVLKDTALIHNGVISNSHMFKNTLSTCDSEAILTQYLKLGVREDSFRVQQLSDSLTGYFACAVVTKIDNGWIVDVFKDSTAELVFAVIPELGNAKVYCTEESILRLACLKAGFASPKVYLVKSGYLNRFDAVTGECLETVKFKTGFSPRAWQDDAWWEKYQAGELEDDEDENPNTYILEEFKRKLG